MTAKIKLNAASGGGSISIQAPSSSSNNRVISLPDIADGTLLTSQSSLDSTKLSPAISAGISMADMWRISSSFTGVQSTTDITANWERVDSDGYGQLGTGMTESSGVFTFPSTGIYLIDFRGTGSKGNGEVQYAGIVIKVTTNNSSYSDAANSFNGSGGTGYYYALSCQHILDVTDTSTHKVKFQFKASHPADLFGNSSNTDTGVTFIRLGDT
tara:strand:+ start:193 stop:831 length:639 start_codon:yes stop_codon:yes gene_type:complete